MPRLACFLVLIIAGILPWSIDPGQAAPAPAVLHPQVDPITHGHLVETLPGSKLSLRLAPVPGGVFLLGSPPTEKGRRPHEGPQRRVRIRPFWMSTTEITWDLYDLYRGKGVTSQKVNENLLAANADAVTRPTLPYIDETWGHGRSRYPVLGISHHAAMEFCHWLSKTTGRFYRLPTEAEWEWACRAGSSTAFSHGDDLTSLGKFAWYDTNANDTTHPVGSKIANAWGLFDMHGNVAEWCLDAYHATAYADLSPGALHLHPFRLPGSARYPHVVRGGSYADAASACRSAARVASAPAWNQADPQVPQSIWWLANEAAVGFRVVRAVEEQPGLRGHRSKVTARSPDR
ncbi:MAG: SUMF1/EgtB/PvdO family nonheme iron enzyme [Gemmataceae bacterium]